MIAIETRDSLPDFSTVKQKLLEEGNRRKEKSEKEEEQADTQKAFAMENKKQKEHAKQHLKKQFKGKCFKCDQVGHFARNCKAKGNVHKRNELLNMVGTSQASRSNRW